MEHSCGLWEGPVGEDSVGAVRTGAGGQPVCGSGASRFPWPVEPGSVLDAPLCRCPTLIPKGLGVVCLGSCQTGV